MPEDIQMKRIIEMTYEAAEPSAGLFLATDSSGGSAKMGVATLLSNEAPMFSASESYAAGDIVLYDAKLYKFTAAHQAGAWTGLDAERITMGEDLAEVKTDLDLIKSQIGDVKTGSASSTIPSAGIDDAYVTGASVDLSPGVWVVTAQFPFGTGSSSGVRNMSVQLSPVSGASGSGGYKMVRVTAANQSWASVEITDIITLTQPTTVYLKAASSMTFTSPTTNTIKAVRIK